MYNMDFAPKPIAVDFDETITLNPSMWMNIMNIFNKNGFDVFICTWRFETEWPEDFEEFRRAGFKVFCTGRQAKRTFMEMNNISVDIWIDDTPEAIIYPQTEIAEKVRKTSNAIN